MKKAKIESTKRTAEKQSTPRQKSEEQKIKCLQVQGLQENQLFHISRKKCGCNSKKAGTARAIRPKQDFPYYYFIRIL